LTLISSGVGAPGFVADIGVGNTIALIVVLCLFIIGAPYLLLRLLSDSVEW